MKIKCELICDSGDGQGVRVKKGYLPFENPEVHHVLCSMC